MVGMRSLRSPVGAALVVALVAGLAFLCPCPETVMARGGHDCCTAEGIRAAPSCCPMTPAPAASAATHVAAAAPALAPADLPTTLAVSLSAPVLPRPARRAAPPPAVLRI